MKPAAAQQGLFQGATKHLVTGAPEWSGSRIAKLGIVPAAAAGAPTPGLGVTRGRGGQLRSGRSFQNQGFQCREDLKTRAV